MLNTTTAAHEITVKDSDDKLITWACKCGWYTIEYRNAPSYHTPIEDRMTEHLAKAEALDSGRVWDEIPAGSEFQLNLSTDVHDNKRATILAVWLGGCCLVAVVDRNVSDWDRDIEAIVNWRIRSRSRQLRWARTGFPVRIDELHAMAK